MNGLPWKKRRIERQLSRYLDGELDEAAAAGVGEHLAFDAGIRRQLSAYERVDALTQAALTPERVPDAARFADRLVQGLDAAPEEQQPVPAPRRRLKPAVLASIGILVTAGITLAGLRRRGLV